MAEHVEYAATIEDLNRLTRTGLEPDAWTGVRLRQAIEETRLILLLDFPKEKIYRDGTLASVRYARREAWFVSKQMTVQHEARLAPCLFGNPASLESTTWGQMPAGAEWYAATKYWIGHEGRFMNCGYGQLPIDVLAGWLANGLADITASFDEALAFLEVPPSAH